MEKKMVSTSQKISCPLARISSFFENYFLVITIIVSNSNKIILTKKILFPPGRKSVCTSRIKDIEKYVSNIGKHGFHFKNIWKNRKKLMSTGRNMVRL